MALPIAGNRSTASRAGENVARDFAYDLLQSVEPYGILITAGDNDTFPLWYAQEVEGVRRDVTVANLSLMNTEWHLKQLRRRPTDTFDPASAIPLWQGSTDTPDQPLGTDSAAGWAKPTAPGLPDDGGRADGAPRDRADADRCTAAGWRHQPADRGPGADPAGLRHDPPDPRQPRQAADLLQLECGRLSRSDLWPRPST